MARIRSIHPGQANDVDFTECSMPARLLAILLRNFADDNGVFVWREKQIKMDCFPADSIDVGPLLDELIANKQVKRFTKSGIDYGIFRNFRRWQRPEKPKTIHPIDDDLLEYGGQSPTNRRPVADESPKVSADGKELEPEMEPEPDKGKGECVESSIAHAQDLKFWDEVQGYLSKSDELTDWEINFLHSIKKIESLSKPQAEKLQSIRDKVKATGKPDAPPVPIVIIREGTPEWEELKKSRPRLVARDIQTPAGIIRGEYGRAA